MFKNSQLPFTQQLHQLLEERFGFTAAYNLYLPTSFQEPKGCFKVGNGDLERNCKLSNYNFWAFEPLNAITGGDIKKSKNYRSSGVLG